MKGFIIKLTIFAYTFIIGVTISVICLNSKTITLSQSVSIEIRPTFNEQTANIPAPLRESSFEKLGERPVREMPGCFMTLQFANEHVGWMSCLDHLWKTSDGGRSWQEIYRPENGRFLDYYLVNTNTMLARTIDTYQKSEDGGYTWKTMPIPLTGRESYLDNVQFLKDGLHGWLAASNFVPCPQRVRSKLGVHSLSSDGKRCLKGYIFYTEDGGRSWQQQPFASNLGSSIGIQVTRDERIWAFHDLYIYYFSEDEWRKVDYTKGRCNHKALLDSIDFYQKTLDPAAPDEIFFVGDTGWLSFSNGYLAKSADGGHVWCDLFDLKPLTNNPKISFRKLYFSDAKNGWGLADYVYRTKDGGATWRKIETNMEIEDMYFLDVNHGWVVSKEGIFRIKD